MAQRGTFPPSPRQIVLFNHRVIHGAAAFPGEVSETSAASVTSQFLFVLPRPSRPDKFSIQPWNSPSRYLFVDQDHATHHRLNVHKLLEYT